MFNGDSQVFGTYIWKTSGCNRPNSAVGKSIDVGSYWGTTWHEYAVEYDGKGRVTFVFDGQPFNVVTDATFFDVPYYMILDTSVGSARAGPPNRSTVFPTKHTIDYVRVSQLASRVTIHQLTRIVDVHTCSREIADASSSRRSPLRRHTATIMA